MRENSWFRQPHGRSRGFWLGALVLACALPIVFHGVTGALLAAPLLVFGGALWARGRAWAVFGLFGLLAALAGSLILGELPLSAVALVGIPAALVIFPLLGPLLRFDRLAGLLALALSGAAGVGVAAVGEHQPLAPGLKQWTPSGSSSPLLVDTAAPPLFAAPLVPPTFFACRGELTPQRRLIFDFEGDRLRPLAHGPRIAERPPLPFGHERAALSRALGRRGKALAGCYRWARYHGSRELAGIVRLSIAVGMWGEVGAVRAAMPAGGGTAADRARLLRCTERVLAGLHLGDARPVATAFDVAVRFKPAKQARPRRAPPRPADGAVERGPAGRCVRRRVHP